MTITNTDAYKLSHKGFMDEGTEFIYSNMTPRSSKYMPVLHNRFDDKIVWFGLQYFIKDYLMDEWDRKFFSKPKDKVIKKYKRIFDNYLGQDAVDMAHFEALHHLGYLPIEIKSLPEGSRVNIKVPFFTIKNTKPAFAWITNYLETVMSCELWKPSTVATIIREYRELANAYAIKTTGSTLGTEFQIHGFEFRGMSGRHDAAICAAGFLLSSNGTDTVPAIELLEDYYNADGDEEFIAASVPASEHSIACLGTAVKGELESFRKWITQDYPTGIVSLVSDTYDFWEVITTFAEDLKDDILARPKNDLGLSKVVFRPDSGNPTDIICGLSFETVSDALNLNYMPEEDVVYCEDTKQYYKVTDTTDENGFKWEYSLENLTTAEVKGAVECLWDIFGGTVTEQGYRLLDEHVGLIYGDSITLTRANEIFERLENKGFASTNVVFGVGSYTSQMITRDSAGMAVKATWAQVYEEGYDLFKDPITDDGIKKSAKGLLRVEKEGEDYVLYDQQTPEQEQQGELQTVFKNGVLYKETSLAAIRERLWS